MSTAAFEISGTLKVEDLQDTGSFGLFEVALETFAAVTVPIVIATCLFIAFFSLRSASNLSGRASLKYFSYAFGIYFLSLGVPLLLLALSLFFDDSFSEIGEGMFDWLTTISIVVGTFFLIVGTRKLRREVDTA